MKKKIILYIFGGLCILALLAFIAQPMLGALGKQKQKTLTTETV